MLNLGTSQHQSGLLAQHSFAVGLKHLFGSQGQRPQLASEPGSDADAGWAYPTAAT